MSSRIAAAFKGGAPAAAIGALIGSFTPFGPLGGMAIGALLGGGAGLIAPDTVNTSFGWSMKGGIGGVILGAVVTAAVLYFTGGLAAITFPYLLGGAALGGLAGATGGGLLGGLKGLIFGTGEEASPSPGSAQYVDAPQSPYDNLTPNVGRGPGQSIQR